MSTEKKKSVVERAAQRTLGAKKAIACGAMRKVQRSGRHKAKARPMKAQRMRANHCGAMSPRRDGSAVGGWLRKMGNAVRVVFIILLSVRWAGHLILRRKEVSQF